MDAEKLKKSTTTDGKAPDPGMEGKGAPQPINPATGQHKAYWVLSEEERAKGFVRPVRRSYIHSKIDGPTHPLRDLTPDEHSRYDEYGYVKFEEYSKDGSGRVGRFWTQADLDRFARGCGEVTTMSDSIAETYARDPSYYGSTFCVACRNHYPVKEFEWVDGGVVGS